MHLAGAFGPPSDAQIVVHISEAPHAVRDVIPALLPGIKLHPSLALCSDLLDEEADPLEVLPNSTISGPLFLLFRVLYADWDAFKSWGDLDGGHLCFVQVLHAAFAGCVMLQSSEEGAILPVDFAGLHSLDGVAAFGEASCCMLCTT